MKKIVTVLGARPQFVKASLLSRAMQEMGGIAEAIVHTGQHYDREMSDVFFEQLGIPSPKHVLGIAGGTHGDMTGRMLCALEPVVMSEAPDCLLVYGDTNSTLAGALVASKLNIPIAHVEAGLRSYNRQMPEEVNRLVTDHLSTLLFCPTVASVENLRAEGILAGVHQVGDIMYDAALHYSRVAAESPVSAEVCRWPEKGYVLATVHRQENTDDPLKLRRIIDALAALSADVPVVLPLHPRTRARLEALQPSVGASLAKLHLLPPVGYLEMLLLERRAGLVMTDSGGVQKEAYFFKVPCVTLRDQTEWVELVEMGWNILVDVLVDDIADKARKAMGARGTDQVSPYGDGNAVRRIASLLSESI
ncbi:MAG: UDP-N-acetylglucosamine 2-epimerase (non-hydrolyzing) [Steroidobacteraceae bacterium]